MVTTTKTEVNDTALITGVVRWSHGSAILRAGQRWEGSSLLLRERPELFGPAGVPQPLGVVGRKPRCWHCKTEFTPSGNRGQVQRYCGSTCRRRRENELKQAVRLVSKRNYPSIPQAHGRNAVKNVRNHVGEVEGLVAMVRGLISHLGGQLEVGPPPQVDEDVLPLSDKQDLLNLAYRAWGELVSLLNQSRSRLQSASQNAEHQANADRNWAEHQARERAAGGHASRWDDELAELDKKNAHLDRPNSTDLDALKGVR